MNLDDCIITYFVLIAEMMYSSHWICFPLKHWFPNYGDGFVLTIPKRP
jgi:hypothetical protein